MLVIPVKCPNCMSTLERVKDQLFCRNLSCSARQSKSVEKYAKTMRIKGLGEKTIEKLKISSVNDIYSLSEKDLTTVLGNTVGSKVFLEIEKSKETTLGLFLSAMSIPLIGKTAGDKISQCTNKLEDIDLALCKNAGLGEKAAISLSNWVENYIKNEYIYLPLKFSQELSKPDTFKLNVVITGKLDDFPSRNKAKDYLSDLQVNVLSSVSSKVNYLICDKPSSSSSVTKAKSLNIPIITMSELLGVLNK